MPNKPIKSYPSAASTYGNVIPHSATLQRIGLQDKTAKADEDKKRIAKEEKLIKNREKRKQQVREQNYRFTSFIIRKDHVRAYIAGDTSLPGRELALGYNGITLDDEFLIRSDPVWKQFARSVYDKLVDQITNTDYEPIRTNKGYQRNNPNSWSSIARNRSLLVKDILIRNKTVSAKILFSD